MSRRLVVLLLVGLGALLPLSGCAKRLPSVVAVQGTVLLNGVPLPSAAVTFMPQLENFGAESNSTAVTDDNGKFTLTCAYNSQPGAVVGKHMVLITDPPLPEDMRDIRDARVLAQYRAQLGNRPIPQQYSSATQSPIRIEIKQGQEPVTIELTR